MSEKLGPYELDQIYTGDARELAKEIPDESIDLIFTDPVYDRIDDYRWLAEMAARVLKPDSACLSWQATPLLAKTLEVMESNLSYAWLLYWQRHGHIAPGRPGLCVITTCMWHEKGHSTTYTKIADWCGTTNNGIYAREHDWGKPKILLSKWINAFTSWGAIVFDPFTGGGTVPAVCKMLGRHYLAFEIDPDTAERARQRVQNTQPPLFVPQPEQLEIDVVLNG